MKAIRVLLVDDDEIDRMSVRRAFVKRGVAAEIVEARNGREALDVLRGTAGAPPLPRPYLILLDLNMPVMNGHEFLAALREDPALSGATVFVLSTSTAGEDIAEGYRRNVAGYMVKSHVGESFMEAVKLLEAYWRVVELPESGEGRLF